MRWRRPTVRGIRGLGGGVVHAVRTYTGVTTHDSIDRALRSGDAWGIVGGRVAGDNLTSAFAATRDLNKGHAGVSDTTALLRNWGINKTNTNTLTMTAAGVAGLVGGPVVGGAVGAIGGFGLTTQMSENDSDAANAYRTAGQSAAVGVVAGYAGNAIRGSEAVQAASTGPTQSGAALSSNSALATGAQSTAAAIPGAVSTAAGYTTAAVGTAGAVVRAGQAAGVINTPRPGGPTPTTSGDPYTLEDAPTVGESSGFSLPLLIGGAALVFVVFLFALRK